MNLDIQQTYHSLVMRLQNEVGAFTAFLDLIKQQPAGQVFVAGGAVRDSFSQTRCPIKDVDIFLSKFAFDTMRPFLQENGNLSINQFGSFRWTPGQNDTIYYDIIIIQNFYNGLSPCLNITDVLMQFDITVNAVAFDLVTGEFFDPLNALRDIKDKILRVVRFDYPDIPVSSSIALSRNTVLWFRLVYYARKLNLYIEENTRHWIEQNAYREKEISTFSYYFFSPVV